MPAATNRQLAVRLAVGARARSNARSRRRLRRGAGHARRMSRRVARVRPAVRSRRRDAIQGVPRICPASIGRRCEGHSPWTPESVDAEPLLVPDVTRDPSLERYLPIFAREADRCAGVHSAGQRRARDRQVHALLRRAARVRRRRGAARSRHRRRGGVRRGAWQDGRRWLAGARRRRDSSRAPPSSARWEWAASVGVDATNVTTAFRPERCAR